MSQLKAQIDKFLTEVASGYQPQGLIADKILPTVNAAQMSGKLAKYGTQHLRLEVSLKGGRGEYRRVETIARDSTTFVIEGHGLEGLVTKDDYRNVEKPFDAEKDETMGLKSKLSLEFEKALADNLTSTSIITQNQTLSGSDQFSDYANSSPIEVFAAKRKVVRDACGMAPNFAAMDWSVYNMLRYHPQLLDALGFKYARPGGLKEDEIASALDVDKIYVAKGMYESANEGQSSVLAPVWGKDIVLGVAPDRAQIMQVSLGYIVRPTGSTPQKVYKYAVNNPPESNAILVEDEYDLLLSNVSAAYLLKAVIA